VRFVGLHGLEPLGVRGPPGAAHAEGEHFQWTDVRQSREEVDLLVRQRVINMFM
jgi:hypothetical protein